MTRAEPPLEKPNTFRPRRVTAAGLQGVLEAHRKWLDSEGHDGKCADLSQTDIQHIDFARSDLRGARFDFASLHYTNFDGADLRGASFLGADLLGTKLGDANLQDTNFEGAQNCLYHQFAGAKLSRAKLPENIATFNFLDHVDETSKNARSIFLAMVIACIYSWLTITTTSDAALLSNRASSPLPIIQTNVPIAGFYLAAPLLLLALYFYMHLYLQSLWRGLATLPAVFPDGRTLDERAYPWLLVSVVRSFFPRLRETKPPFSRLTILLSIIFAWMLVPVTLAVFWLRYLPRSDWPWSAAHILLLVLVVCYGTAFYSRAKATLRKREPPKVMLYAYSGTAVVVGLLAFLISDGVINGVPAERKPYVQPYAHRLIVPSVCRFLGYIPFLDLKEAELSLKPPGWTGLGDESPGQIAQVQGARLQNRTLRYANLEGAFLVKADLSGVDLRGANLQHADLRNARLWGASLEGAVVHQANLEGASFRSTKLDDVILHSTRNLTQDQLRGACGNMAPKWLPEGMTIEPCADDRQWPIDSRVRSWPHGW